MYFKYRDYYNLYLSAKFIPGHQKFIKTVLFKYMVIEGLMTIFHPNILAKGKIIVSNEKWNLIATQYYLNDFFCSIQVLRFVFVFFSMIANTRFYSARADRVSKMMSVEYTMYFSFKCLVYKYPLITQLILTGTISIVMALLYQILEGSIPDKMVPVNFYDAMWVIFIIITTVGFGDIYAVTNLGRLTMIITSLVGIFLVSLIIMSLQKEVQLNDYEMRAYDLISRLKAKQDNVKISNLYTKYGMQYLAKKRKYLRLKKAKPLFESLTPYEKELKALLSNRIRLKDQFSKKIRIFLNIFEPYNIGESLRKRLKDINERLNFYTQTDQENEVKINKIAKLFNLMKSKEFAPKFLNTSFNSSFFSQNTDFIDKVKNN